MGLASSTTVATFFSLLRFMFMSSVGQILIGDAFYPILKLCTHHFYLDLRSYQKIERAQRLAACENIACQISIHCCCL